MAVPHPEQKRALGEWPEPQCAQYLGVALASGCGVNEACGACIWACIGGAMGASWLWGWACGWPWASICVRAWAQGSWVWQLQ